MNKAIFVFTLFLVSIASNAQLKRTATCPAITVDVLDGRVNGLRITDNVTQVKAKLPCFTAAENESGTAKCGGGVFYKDRDISFYTARDYVEIGPKFKGKLSVPLMGANRNGLYKWLGNPKIKDAKWDAYTTAYGILIVYFNSANRVNKLQLSTQSAETIQLCE